MARLIPSDSETALSPDPVHAGEARTLARLRDGLSDRYTVYHGVHWARAQSGGSAYGEIDFIVVNPYGHLLAIEQKDTQIFVAANDLWARYGGTRSPGPAARQPHDKSLTTQVNRNLNALRAQFSRRYPGRTLQVDYLLYLPASRLAGALPSSVDPARVIDAEGDANLIATIESLFDALATTWSDDRLEDLPRIDEFLSQRVGAAPHIGLLGRSAREFTTRLSGGLSTWVSRLSMQPWRLRVRGTAGSGKTQLALQALQHAHAAGQRALYVCFNRPLADAMKLLAPQAEEVVTFHELARMVCESPDGPAIDFDHPDVFAQLTQRFIELSPRLADTFDALIIDEGQDFEPAWVHSLLAMARNDAHLLLLEDPEQALYARAPVELPGWVSLASPVNYRSPQLLVEFINWLALTDEPVEAGSAVLGFDPKWHVYAQGESPIPATEAALQDLLAEGYSPENIAVLSFQGQQRSALVGDHGPTRLAGQTVRRYVGFDGEGLAQWSDGPLLVDTVNRFKGQAADAVVITEVDFEQLGERERRRLFVGLTRARLQAVLVTTERAGEVLRGRLGA